MTQQQFFLAQAKTVLVFLSFLPKAKREEKTFSPFACLIWLEFLFEWASRAVRLFFLSSWTPKKRKKIDIPERPPISVVTETTGFNILRERETQAKQAHHSQLCPQARWKKLFYSLSPLSRTHTSPFASWLLLEWRTKDFFLCLPHACISQFLLFGWHEC